MPEHSPENQTPYDPFDHCDYYDASDSPELSHASEEEALEAYIDLDPSPDCDVEATIRKMGPITVTGYVRKTVSPELAARWAASLAESMNEWWSEEEYGDPDDMLHGPGDQRFVDGATVMIQAAIDRTHVWSCDRAGKRTYTSDEIIVMMRKECPYWFEKSDGEESGAP